MQEIDNEPPMDTKNTEKQEAKMFYTIQQKKSVTVYAKTHSAVKVHEFFGIPRTTINRY